ncbi:uncharacterized protein [Anabrus simplex]|uniref:uncharacterized protein n=1 Tax=Anabrus simplex TaxID=316456 RepID=UPI0035A2D736
MDSEEADHSFGSVRLTEGDNDNSELSSEEEIIEGAVGFSPTQNHWLVYAVNEPAYVEETDRKPGNNFNLSEKRISSPSTCENTPEGLRERPVYSQRRHSFSGAPVRRQSLPGFDESGLCSCRSPLARQASVLRRSDNGMMRQVSVPSFFSNRQNLIRVRRNSLQLDRGEIGLAPSGSSSTRNQYAIMNPNDSARMGSDLFMMYLREEIERSEIQSPPEGLPQFSRNTLENGEFVQMGTHLRYMADEFSKSDLRERVRERAGSVNLSTLDFTSFSDLLFGTFQSSKELEYLVYGVIQLIEYCKPV